MSLNEDLIGKKLPLTPKKETLFTSTLASKWVLDWEEENKKGPGAWRIDMRYESLWHYALYEHGNFDVQVFPSTKIKKAPNYTLCFSYEKYEPNETQSTNNEDDDYKKVIDYPDKLIVELRVTEEYHPLLFILLQEGLKKLCVKDLHPDIPIQELKNEELNNNRYILDNDETDYFEYLVIQWVNQLRRIVEDFQLALETNPDFMDEHL